MTQEIRRTPARHAAPEAGPPAAARFRAGRDVRLLWCAGASDAIGSNASGIVLPLLLLGLGHSVTFVGVVGGVCTAAGLLVVPLVAVPADRGARKAVMFWSAVVAATVTAALALAVAQGRPPLVLLLGAVLVECVAAACYEAAAPGTVALLAAPRDIPRVTAGVEAGEQGALVIGPALGGALFQLSRAVPFVVDAASYAVTAVCVRAMRADLRADLRASVTLRDDQPVDGEASGDGTSGGPGASEVGAGDDGGVRAGLRMIRSSPLLRLVLLWATAVNGVLEALSFYALVVLGRHGHGGAPMGTVLAVAGAAGLAGALAAPPLVRRMGSGRVLVAVTWVLVPLVAGLAGVGGPWAFGALFGAVCLTLPLVSVVLQSTVAGSVLPGVQARVAAVVAVASGVVGVVTPALVGVLAQHVALAATPVVCAAVLTMLALRTTASAPRLLSAATPTARVAA